MENLWTLNHVLVDPENSLLINVVILANWSSNSPDLNPIENLWQILKTRVEKQVNEMLVKKQTVTVEVFRGVIQKEWEEIDQSTYVNLVRSMPTRLNEIIEGNGNKINY